ncbi:MAG TPA: gluconate 2-dehydrogenase subunit 3 family protein [Puia sp.]|nr:gluconate 2-dehydrogenase subunit 3 family protein [Puia sp.]
MKRRKAIKDLLVASGGALALPWWMEGCRTGEKGVGVLPVVVDTIVPGAVELGVDRYVDRMIADCYEQPVQENVRKQLAALEGKGFVSASKQQREAMLLELTEKDEKDFFAVIKSETIRGYTTSQKVMEEYFHYKVAPGVYSGCVPVHA